MIKRISTIGSSKGLILDKTLLGLLGIEDAEEVSVEVEGRRLIVERVSSKARAESARKSSKAGAAASR